MPVFTLKLHCCFVGNEREGALFSFFPKAMLLKAERTCYPSQPSFHIGFSCHHPTTFSFKTMAVFSSDSQKAQHRRLTAKFYF